jgi:hypothetical protein
VSANWSLETRQLNKGELSRHDSHIAVLDPEMKVAIALQCALPRPWETWPHLVSLPLLKIGRFSKHWETLIQTHNRNSLPSQQQKDNYCGCFWAMSCCFS